MITQAGKATAARLEAINQSGTNGSTPLPAAFRRYEIVPDHAMCPVLIESEYGAFQEAQNYYANKLKQDFWPVFWQYMEDGYVVCRPHLFAMAMPVEWLGHRGWFIEFATGNMKELASCLPRPLEFFAFRRDGGSLRVVWDYEYFKNKVVEISIRKVV